MKRNDPMAVNSREKILEAVRRNRPDPAAEQNQAPFLQEFVPDGDASFSLPQSPLLRQFSDALRAIGGEAVLAPDLEIPKEDLRSSLSGGSFIINTVAGLGPLNAEISSSKDASFLEPVHKAYLRASFGVAENGAVWLPESALLHRLIPFISPHLVILLDSGRIVANMQDAYRQVDMIDQGYGVFIAGPSRTADIEQSLVIGAHGGISLRVYITGLITGSSL